MAYVSGSLTAPTLPAGWTQVDTDATSSGSGKGAQIVGCSVASSSSDTGSGTWTSASTVGCVAYSGTNVGTTANCNTTGLGGGSNFAHQNARGSTTITYPGITMLAGGTSWVVGLAADSAAVPGTPSLMAGVSSGGAGPATNVSDTNGPIGSWNSQTVSVISGTWMTEVMEVRNIIAATPTFSPTAGGYGSTQNVTMSSTTTGATICYRTDGVSPSASTPGTCDSGSTSYIGPIATNTSTTFKAIATKVGYNNSAASSISYIFGQANVSGTGGSLTLTSPTIDSTNAILIVVACLSGAGAAPFPATISDSAGNSGWVTRPVQSSTSAALQVFYILNPTNTSTSHSFTCHYGGTTITSILVSAYFSPYFPNFQFDQDCAFTSTSSTPVTSIPACSSPLTPSKSNELLLAYFFQNGGAALPTIDSGLAISNSYFNVSSPAVEAILSDTNTNPIQPTWTFPSIAQQGSVSTMLAFKPVTGGSGRKRVRVNQQ